MKLAISALLSLASLNVWSASCMEEEQTANERSSETCAQPYVHPNPHERGALHAGAIRDAIVEELAWARTNGVFGIRKESRLPFSECQNFLKDFVQLDNIEILSAESATWATIDVGSTLPRLDPRFKDWRLAQGRQVNGYVVVRWRNSQEFLLRARRMCGGTGCSSLTFQHLDAHDQAKPIACSFMTVAAPYWRNWSGQVTPIALEMLGIGQPANPQLQASRWPASVGKWIKLGEVSLGGLYYESDSISGPDETKSVTVLIDYADRQVRQGREISSLKYFVTVDCVNRVLAANTESGYSGRMASGGPLFAAFYNRRFQPPGWNPQMFTGILGVVCKAHG